MRIEIYQSSDGQYIVERWVDGKMVAISTYTQFSCVELVIKAYSK